MIEPDALFLLSGARRGDMGVEGWFASDDPLRQMVRPWFETIRDQGEDVGELLHDHCPTACVGEAAFAYVNAYKAHAAVGFFHGAALPDPAGLLEGAGRRMRHVKLRWGEPVNEAALKALVSAAYQDVKARLAP